MVLHLNFLTVIIYSEEASLACHHIQYLSLFQIFWENDMITLKSKYSYMSISTNTKINAASSKHGKKHCLNLVTLSDQTVQYSHIYNVQWLQQQLKNWWIKVCWNCSSTSSQGKCVNLVCHGFVFILATSPMLKTAFLLIFTNCIFCNIIQKKNNERFPFPKQGPCSTLQLLPTKIFDHGYDPENNRKVRGGQGILSWAL